MADDQQDLSGEQPRPSIPRRHSSRTSEISQSLSEGSASHLTGAHKPQRHVVGAPHGRLGTRNTSFGKNLNKLNKDGGQASKTQNRSKSGETSLPGSPRPSHAVKRNSTFVIPRNTSHTALKKNYSSGHLPRHGSSKNVTKSGRVQNKRTRSGQSDRSQDNQSQPPSPAEPEPPLPPTVRFDLGNDDPQAPGDDEWTEDSTSPLTSRNASASHTRSNSVQVDGPADVVPSTTQQLLPTLTRQSPTPQTRNLPDRSRSALAIMNGSSSQYPSYPQRAPDADAITSRILQKHNALPQLSNITASVTPDRHHPPSIPHSHGSTVANGTPGRDLVSRFINGTSGSASAAGTPNEDSFLLQRPREDKNELEPSKRNNSVPDMNKLEGHRRASSEHTAGTLTPTELPPSRTQQKLLLQRASSAVESGKHIPAVLPTRPGAPQLLGGNMPSPFGESATSAQMQALFNQTAKEYSVVRRYRNPLAEGIGRLSGSSDVRQKHINRPKSSKGVSGSANGSGGSLSQTYREHQATSLSSARRPQPSHSHVASASSRKEENEPSHTHKSRVSFDLPLRPAPEDPEKDDGSKTESFGSDNGRVRDEASEICRRMWALDYSGGGGNEGSPNRSITAPPTARSIRRSKGKYHLRLIRPSNENHLYSHSSGYLNITTVSRFTSTSVQPQPAAADSLRTFKVSPSAPTSQQSRPLPAEAPVSSIVSHTAPYEQSQLVYTNTFDNWVKRAERDNSDNAQAPAVSLDSLKAVRSFEAVCEQIVPPVKTRTPTPASEKSASIGSTSIVLESWDSWDPPRGWQTPNTQHRPASDSADSTSAEGKGSEGRG